MSDAIDSNEGTAAADAALGSEGLDATRADLQAVIKHLRGHKVTQRAVAQEAGWDPSFLSQFLTGSRGASADNIGRLATTLQTLAATHGIDPVLDARLQDVAARYGVKLSPPSEPNGPISPSSPNFVRRDSLMSSLQNAVKVPGMYRVDGPAMTGVTTTMAWIEQMLVGAGWDVVFITGNNLAAPAEQSRTSTLGAVASIICRSSDLLKADFYEVEERVEERMLRAKVGLAVLVDGIDILPKPLFQDLLQVFRGWSTNRARNVPAYLKSSTWFSHTSDVPGTRKRSGVFPTTFLVDWFSRSEVSQLASSLASIYRADADADAETLADAAYERFRGQPELTHLYLFDVAQGITPDLDAVGSTSPVEPSVGKPINYELHIERLAKLIVLTLGAWEAQEAVRNIDTRKPVKEGACEYLFRESAAKTVPEADESEDGEVIEWSSPFYAARLPAAINRIEAAPRT